MIIDQPFNRHASVVKFRKTLEEKEVLLSKALDILELLNPIFDKYRTSDEFTFGDIDYEWSLNINLQLTDKGIFNSIEPLMNELAEALKCTPSIGDAEYITGKYIMFYPSYLDFKGCPSIQLWIAGNSKCKKVLVDTKTYHSTVYRIDCGDMQPMKEITYVSSLNPIGSDNG